VTLADWKLTAGVGPGEVVTERQCRGLTEVYWPGRLRDCDGWWWCVARGQVVLAGGWTTGNKRDRDMELARAIMARPEEAL
jgi:hypothetical protein